MQNPRISEINQKLKRLAVALEKSQDRAARIRGKMMVIYHSACDKDCEKDGNVHKPVCSIYKVRLPYVHPI